MAIIQDKEINLILSASAGDPFIFLGPHICDDGKLVIRFFNPGVAQAFIQSDDFPEEIPMEKIHSDGLFEQKINTTKIISYNLKLLDHHGNRWECADPYTFSQVLTEYDIHLFNEGNHHRIYRKMGAHVIEHEGFRGTHFCVWAPEAAGVSVTGSFNNWDKRSHQMRLLGNSGVWELFIPGMDEGELYRFAIRNRNGDVLEKSDPYAFFTEKRPANASIVYNPQDKHVWEDRQWMDTRKETDWLSTPISIYEVHLGSWMRKGEHGEEFASYEELADKLVHYVREQNFTHVELMPVSEHPLDESWGYQVTGYFSVTSRFGKPEGLKLLIDSFHQAGIGVILDWVPGHFPKDSFGLGRFDGTAVYEHEDPRQGEHRDWGTYIFNYGRPEVKNFLITNALYWLDEYHIDGLRVDAVASMLYLDYSRNDGEWVANKYGGRENLEAIEFLQYFNSITHQYYPGILTIAEESTSFPGVSKPTYLGGLGFSMKWNMGWMNDSLQYISQDPLFRKYSHNNLTFSLVYAFSENFMLVLSHDEVVHGKGSMIQKMPGDLWKKFANLRLFLAYCFAHPGKKLNFMGFEIAQWNEWYSQKSLDWHLLENDPNRGMQRFVKELNSLYKDSPSLYELDFEQDGFQWIDFHDTDNSIISFIRKSKSQDEIMICIFNFTPLVQGSYRIGVPHEGFYREMLNSDSENYWGSNVGNLGGVSSDEIMWHGFNHSIEISVPPLAALYFRYKKDKVC